MFSWIKYAKKQNFNKLAFMEVATQKYYTEAIKIFEKNS